MERQSIVRPWLVLLVLILGLATSESSTSTERSVDAKPQELQILVLLSYSDQLPWTKSFRSGLARFQNEKVTKVEYTFVSLASFLDSAKNLPPDLATLLQDKYQDKTFHGVLAESYFAVEFIKANRAGFYPNLLKVFYSGEKLSPLPGELSIQDDINAAIDGTLEIALQQNPEAQTAYVIGSNHPSSIMTSRFLLPKLRNQKQLKVQFLQDFTFDSLYTQILPSIPESDLIFYTLVFSDFNGDKVIPKEALYKISHNAKAPVYTFWSTLMGSGCVGGHLIDAETASYYMALALYDYNKDGTYRTSYPSLRTILDWTAIQRHGLSTHMLGWDVAMINRPDQPDYGWLKLLGTMIVIGLLLLPLLRRSRPNWTKDD